MAQPRTRLPFLAVGVLLLIFFPHPSAPRAAPAQAFAQTGTPGQFRTTVHTVEVHATVRGADGQFVSGLSKDDFELLDNGKKREISVFAGDVQPITVALVLDRSGSVARQADQIAGSAGTFVDGLLPADQASIDTLTLECQPLTTDKTQLKQVLQSPLQGDGGSPVWSGVDRAITSLGGISGRRAILLFSDGDDYGSQLPPEKGIPVVTGQPCHPWADPSEASLADASRRAAREGIMIYTVSVEGPTVQTHDGDLRAIARGTGGDRYRLRDQDELSAAFSRIVDELHHQYLLGFAPDALDGKVHTLTVRVKRQGVAVRARESYIALDASPPVTTTPLAPAAPLTDADVEQAIRDGSNGQKAQALCMAVRRSRLRL
jgi:VWFA-related protein